MKVFKHISKVLLSFGLVLLLANIASAEIKFKPGFQARLRHEFWQNTGDQNSDAKDNRNYFRFKLSLDGNLSFDEKNSVYLRLTDEFKTYTYFYQSATGKKGYRFDINEVVWDNFYYDIKNILDKPVDIRIGRQDFLGDYGEGFLIADGTPVDGSRTFYFNAIRTRWNKDDKNKIDLVYINDPRYDSFLPIINRMSPETGLNVTNEQGWVLDWQNKDIENLLVEPYFIYKIEDHDHGTRLQSKEGEIYTPGFFAKYNMDPFVFRGQLAVQSGSYGANDREALGGYIFADRNFKDVKFAPQFTLGYIYLSGDDAGTTDNEGWDPLFSRYPWQSELYVLEYSGESGTGYWTNLQMLQMGPTLKLTDKIKLMGKYNYLWANETPSGTSFAVADGKQRGQLLQSKLDYAINKDVSTYFLIEYFIPGNFYPDTADPSMFLRTELKFKF